MKIDWRVVTVDGVLIATVQFDVDRDYRQVRQSLLDTGKYPANFGLIRDYDSLKTVKTKGKGRRRR